MSQPSASDVHTPGSGSKSSSGFKCVSCGAKMENWRSGYHCSDCKVAKHASHDQKSHGRRGGTVDSDGPSQRSGGGTGNNGPRTIDNDRPRERRQPGSKYLDRQGIPQGNHDGDRRKGSKPTPETKRNSKKDTDEYTGRKLGVPQGERRRGPASDPSNPDKSRKGPARHPNFEGDRNVSTIDNPRKVRKATDFGCTDCGGPMDNWRDGTSCCAFDKAAAKPGSAAKPAAGGGVGPAGKVQEEFPACPSCGAPTPDGAKCEDCQAAGAQERMLGDLNIAQTHAGFQGTLADMEEENERREIRRRARARMARLLGLDEDEVAKAEARLGAMPAMVLKAAEEQRFSYAPMYMPGKLDAHGEFVATADELQKAAWSYVEKTAGDRTVYLQHIAKAAGKWVEITSWPYAVEAPMVVGDQVRKATLPAGTVYMGVIWEPWAWDMVKKGKLLGFSMGGWAKRVEAELVVEKAVHPSTTGPEPWQQAGVVNPQSPAVAAHLPFDMAEAERRLAELGGDDADPFEVWADSPS